MTNYQRRRGLPIKVWRTETQTDDRGNKHEVATPATPHAVKCWLFPQRSARAELAGQQMINVIRIGVDSSLSDVGLWSKVVFENTPGLNGIWDVVTPPSYHHGVRATRHWSIDLRKRP